MSDWWRPTLQAMRDALEDGDLARAREESERLLSASGLPARVERIARQNQAAFAPLFPELCPSFTRRQIEIPVEKGWSCFNPSIAARPDGEGYLLVVRSANYLVDHQLNYTTIDGDPFIRTVNYLAELDNDLAILASERIEEGQFRADPPLFPVTGFEDARIFQNGGAWRLSCTVRDRTREGVCQIALLGLDGARIVEMRLLSTGEGRHEKNWMPMAGNPNGRPWFIYSVSPTLVLAYDDVTGHAMPEAAGPGPRIARELGGGSQAIEVDGGRLCLVHDRVDRDDGTRVYLHRWTWFDEEWRLSRLSPPFCLHERGIEFVTGLARNGDDLIVSYGAWDREAWLGTVSIAEVLPLLAPPLDEKKVKADMRKASANEKKRAKKADGPRSTGKKGGPPDAAYEEASGSVGSAVEEPTIVSMTLSGNSRKIIGDALRSVVDWVDWCLVIDTGINDETLEIAREIAGDKLVVRQFLWRHDFAAARNAALGAAHEIGADWALSLDTDERLTIAHDPRPALAASEATVLHVRQRDGSYGKERLFRLPAAGAFVGPTHEAFIRSSGAVATLDGIWFDELKKSAKAYRKKAARDVDILQRYTVEHPRDPRWFYYLGDSHAGLERHEDAVAAFRACYALNGWDEESAWAAYRAAESLLKLGKRAEALEACAIGMTRHAGLAELPWLAAYASYQQGRPAQAVYWARLSATLGNFVGSGASVPRISFRHLPALWEGPFDILRFALREIGDEAGADDAERHYKRARKARRAARKHEGNEPAS